LVIVFPSFFPILAEKPKYQYQGKAYDLKTGNYVYSDNHEEYFTANKHMYSKISYKDANGVEFGKKRIEFYPNTNVPTFRTDDFRDGYAEGAEVQGKSVKLFYRRKAQEEMTEKIHTPRFPAVMDGGFDFFVRENWNKLAEGERMSFRFLVPVQLDDYLFAVEKIKDDSWKGRKALYLKLEIDNFILKRIVNPFLLVYDDKTKRILQFEGLSNINDGNGKSLRVRIVYDYPKDILLD
jgi:hypothetical protein